MVVDPSTSCVLRVEQLYAPEIALQPQLSAELALHRGWRLIEPGSPVPAIAPSGPLVKSLGSVTGLSRDLRAEPFVTAAFLMFPETSSDHLA